MSLEGMRCPNGQIVGTFSARLWFMRVMVSMSLGDGVVAAQARA